MTELLYKFRNWTDPNHKRILTDCEIYFATPLEFNDPFDCKIIPRYDKLNRKPRYSVVLNLFKKDYPEWSDKKLNVETKKFLKVDIFSKETIRESSEGVMDNVLKSVGIFSTTLTKSNILLWSHYANSHEGFCVGFKKHLLNNNIHNSFKRINNASISNEVNYIECYPNILPTDDEDLFEFISKPIFSKYKSWKYEKEFRIVLLSGGCTKFIVKPESIAEITFGCKMDQGEQKEIIQLVKQKLPNVKLYQAKKKYMEFGLDFEEIQL